MRARYNELFGALAAAALAVGVVVVTAAGPAAGQEVCEDPYGCPVPTEPTATPAPFCTVTAPETSGAPVLVVVHHVPAGLTIDLLVDGRVVATATAGPDRPDDTPGVVDVEMSFAADELPAGPYQLVAVGPAFQTTCPSDVVVLGAAVTRAPAAPRSGSSLARTGIGIAFVLAVAIAMLIAGRLILERARRRRKALERHGDDHLRRGPVEVL